MYHPDSSYPPPDARPRAEKNTERCWPDDPAWQHPEIQRMARSHSRESGLLDDPILRGIAEGDTIPESVREQLQVLAELRESTLQLQLALRQLTDRGGRFLEAVEQSLGHAVREASRAAREREPPQ